MMRYALTPTRITYLVEIISIDTIDDTDIKHFMLIYIIVLSK